MVCVWKAAVLGRRWRQFQSQFKGTGSHPGADSGGKSDLEHLTTEPQFIEGLMGFLRVIPGLCVWLYHSAHQSPVSLMMWLPPAFPFPERRLVSLWGGHYSYMRSEHSQGTQEVLLVQKNSRAEWECQQFTCTFTLEEDYILSSAVESQPRSMFEQDGGSFAFVLLYDTVFPLRVGTQQKGRQQCKQLKSQLSSARKGDGSYSQRSWFFLLLQC